MRILAYLPLLSACRLILAAISSTLLASATARHTASSDATTNHLMATLESTNSCCLQLLRGSIVTFCIKYDFVFHDTVNKHTILQLYCIALHCMFIDCTVPTINSCTKVPGSLGIIHDCIPDCHSVSWALMHG